MDTPKETIENKQSFLSDTKQHNIIETLANRFKKELAKSKISKQKNKIGFWLTELQVEAIVDVLDEQKKGGE